MSDCTSQSDIRMAVSVGSRGVVTQVLVFPDHPTLLRLRSSHIIIPDKSSSSWKYRTANSTDVSEQGENERREREERERERERERESLIRFGGIRTGQYDSPPPLSDRAAAIRLSFIITS